MKQFGVGNDIHAISSLDVETMYILRKETFHGVSGGISITYDGLIAPCEANARNDRLSFIYNEETDSLKRLELVYLKPPPPLSQYFQIGRNASLRTFYRNNLNQG